MIQPEEYIYIYICIYIYIYVYRIQPEEAI